MVLMNQKKTFCIDNYKMDYFTEEELHEKILNRLYTHVSELIEVLSDVSHKVKLDSIEVMKQNYLIMQMIRMGFGYCHNIYCSEPLDCGHCIMCLNSKFTEREMTNMFSEL